MNRSLLLLDTHRLTTTTEANDNATPPTTPYINGIFEIISRIHVAYKPITTLRQLLTSQTKTNRGTDREPFIRSVAPTATPSTSVRLAETSQLTEHKRATRKGDVNSHIS